MCAANLTDDSTTAATEYFDGLITTTDLQLFSDGSALGFSIAPSLIKVCSDSSPVHIYMKCRAPGMFAL